MKLKRREKHVPHLMILKKCVNVSWIKSSQSRSNIRTQDLTLAMVSSMETRFANNGLLVSSSLPKASTTTVNTP